MFRITLGHCLLSEIRVNAIVVQTLAPAGPSWWGDKARLKTWRSHNVLWLAPRLAGSDSVTINTSRHQMRSRGSCRGLIFIAILIRAHQFSKVLLNLLLDPSSGILQITPTCFGGAPGRTGIIKVTLCPGIKSWSENVDSFDSASHFSCPTRPTLSRGKRPAPALGGCYLSRSRRDIG